jgi:preprotein translocase subunit SecY
MSTMTWRGLLVTVGVLLFYRLGCQIPVPGLDQETLDRLRDVGGLEMLSIFALGVIPIFSVLLIVEIAAMAVPALGRWRTASRRNAERLHRFVLLAAMAMAAFQAISLVSAPEAISRLVSDLGWEFRLGIVVTFVGATALLGWLGDRITIHGLGNGFWLLLITPSLISMPSAAAGAFELWRQGSVGSAALFATVGYFALAIALLVTVAKPHHGPARSDLSPDVGEIQASRDEFADVWPPLLATYFGGFLIVAVALLATRDMNVVENPSIAVGSPVRIFVITALIALFTYLRALQVGVASTPRRLWMVALAQIIICAAGELLTRYSGLPFAINGSWLILGVAVATSCLASIDSKAQARRESIAPVAS